MAILSPDWNTINKLKVAPTTGEKTLLNFLEANLDDSYEIFFQPYLNGDNPDIVIMRKNSGVLIIEVKDWNLDAYKINLDHTWSLNNKENTIISSPFEQVEKYKYNLFDLHSIELFQAALKDKRNRGVVNCLVYFHATKNEDLDSFMKGHGVKNRYYWSRENLNKSALNQLLAYCYLHKDSKFFDDEVYDSIKRYLQAPYHQIEEGIDIIYTKAQQELIRSEVKPRRKIKGAAGSGKTLVLAKRAVNAHIRTGSEVLILTYNIALRNYIRDRISDVRTGFEWRYFHIMNYHTFFKAQANNYNLKANSIGSFNDINFFKSKENDIKKYDAVFIDEVQDYDEAWLEIITKYFMHDKTEFVVFGDEKQNIYERTLDDNKEPKIKSIPGVWNKSLNTSHRFYSNIGNLALKFQKTIFAQKYSVDDLNVMSQFDFQKRIINYHYFEEENIQALYDLVFKVAQENSIHPSDIGILSNNVKTLRTLDYWIRKYKKEKTITTFETEEYYQHLSNDFYKEKIVYPETTQGAYFVFDKDNFFIDKTCFMIISNNAQYLLGILSSKLFEVTYKSIFSSIELGINGYQYNKHALLKLPIIKPKGSYEVDIINMINNKSYKDIDKYVYDIYNLSKEEIQFIENQ